MNAQDVQQVINLVPGSATALQTALAAGEMRPTESGPALRVEVPTGTLDNSVYDLFRSPDYLLSCVRSADGLDTAYITRNVVKTPPSGLCYHATAESRVPGISSLGLLIGRNVPGATGRAGLYTDAEQYIHPFLTEEQAEVWYYDRLGNDQPGIVLAVDLNTAGCRLLADPRSEDSIIEATRIDWKHITWLAPLLPSVADMQGFLRNQGWICKETVITSTVSGTWMGISASTTGRTLPGAWRKFYQGVIAGTLP
jgi:hypothetical protein